MPDTVFSILFLVVLPIVILVWIGALGVARLRRIARTARNVNHDLQVHSNLIGFSESQTAAGRAVAPEILAAFRMILEAQLWGQATVRDVQREPGTAEGTGVKEIRLAKGVKLQYLTAVKGWEGLEQTHEEHQLLDIRKGAILFSYPGTSRPDEEVRRGAIVWLPAGTPHKAVALEDSEAYSVMVPSLLSNQNGS
jgi:quercetin dioxygenase-like cupin family protein